MDNQTKELTTVELIIGGRQSGRTTALIATAFEVSAYGPVVMEIKNEHLRNRIKRQMAYCIAKGGHRISHIPSAKDRRDWLAAYFGGNAPDYDEATVNEVLSDTGIEVVADHIEHFKSKGGVVTNTSLMVDDCRKVEDIMALAKREDNSSFWRIAAVFDPDDHFIPPLTSDSLQ